MATRKEEKERLRQERLAAQKRQQSSDSTRQRLAVIGAGVILLAVVVGLVVVVSGSGDDKGGVKGTGGVDYGPNAHFVSQAGAGNGIPGDDRVGTPPPEIKTGDLEAAAKAANCDLMQNLPDEGNTHIGNPKQAAANEPDYKTDPPTSGDHVDPLYVQADGAYSEYPDPTLTVHSLEHGRIDMQYSPDLSEDDQLALKGVFDDSPDGMLLFPNPDMPYEVAATAWTQLLGCKTYEGQATLDAIRDFRDTYRGRGPEAVPVVIN